MRQRRSENAKEGARMRRREQECEGGSENAKEGARMRRREQECKRGEQECKGGSKNAREGAIMKRRERECEGARMNGYHKGIMTLDKLTKTNTLTQHCANAARQSTASRRTTKLEII